MRTILLEIEYDGSAYYGWQRQAGFPTIQQQLEEAVEKTTGEKAVVHGSGRTDTGVHALRQVAHFETESRLPDWKVQKALNAYLPRDIAVRRCETAPANFHARFDALAKRYAYLVRASKAPHPLGRQVAHWVPYELDLDRMRRAARHFLGTHDFRSFAGTERIPKSARRTIRSFHIRRAKDRFLFVVEGDGFLMHMVRAMVGTLLEVGRRKMAPERIREILAAKDRRKGGPTAPACGLFLLRVLFPQASKGRKT